MGLRLIPLIHGDVGKLCQDRRASGVRALESTQSINMLERSCHSQSCSARQQQHPHIPMSLASGTARGSAKAPKAALDREL